jgi:hypothetical protein
MFPSTGDGKKTQILPGSFERSNLSQWIWNVIILKRNYFADGYKNRQILPKSDTAENSLFIDVAMLVML